MPSDAAFLGLVPGTETGRWSFTVQEHLARLDGRLYGGAAIAASIAAAELTSEHPALWMTTQFVSTTGADAVVDVHAEVLAAGRRTNQVRVTGADSQGRVIFACLGATGSTRPGPLTGDLERRPVVTPPEESERWAGPVTGVLRAAGLDQIPDPPTAGFDTVIEMRHATVHDHPDPGPGRLCVWVRRRDGVPATRALAAYLADMVPLGIAFAFRTIAGGTSLDNTIRFGGFEETEWILLDIRPHLAFGGYAHGTAHLWSPEGHLLATASQTATMTVFEPSHLDDLTS